MRMVFTLMESTTVRYLMCMGQLRPSMLAYTVDQFVSCFSTCNCDAVCFSKMVHVIFTYELTLGSSHNY